MSDILHNLNVAANCARMARNEATTNDIHMLTEIARLSLLDAYDLQMKEEQRALKQSRISFPRSPSRARRTAAPEVDHDAGIRMGTSARNRVPRTL